MDNYRSNTHTHTHTRTGAFFRRETAFEKCRDDEAIPARFNEMFHRKN